MGSSILSKLKPESKLTKQTIFQKLVKEANLIFFKVSKLSKPQ